MRKSVPIAALAILTVMVAYVASSRTVAAQNAAGVYEVLSPWAEADPIPLRGISPRLDNLNGKKIGLFANSKRSAMPQVRMVETKLKEKFPTIETSIYHSPDPDYIAKDNPDWEKFVAWIKTVDAIVLTVGD